MSDHMKHWSQPDSPAGSILLGNGEAYLWPEQIKLLITFCALAETPETDRIVTQLQKALNDNE